MLFRAENLGPLKTAEVDLSKDLIVLTGPNNSGKTYLAWSVYGLYRSRKGRDRPAIPHWLADELLASPQQRLDFEAITTYWQRFLSSVVDAYAQDIYRCFAAEAACFADAKLSIHVGNPELLTKRLKSGRAQLHMTIGPKWGLDLYRTQEAIVFAVRGAPLPGGGLAPIAWATVPDSERGEVKSYVHYGLWSGMIRAAFERCALFPVERIAVNVFAKELELNRFDLVDKLANEEFDVEEVRQRVGRYPWPIRDSIRVANDLSHVSKEKSQFADLADEMEAALLQGKVGVSEYGEMVFTPDAAPDKRLSVHLTASVVKSLASLVFYFRHRAQPNHFLIIDEPELNLHPDNQRKIARILAKAVNRGFKIMMSTHSDYVIRELNNLIMLNQKSEAAAKLIDELGYDRACLLDPERVGVYLFNERHSEAVPVTETGFEVKTIEDEINQLNLVSQRIYGTLFD